MSTNRERWLATYTEELERAMSEHPDEFLWKPGTTAAGLAARMTDSLARGLANKDSRAIRATCRRLGVTHTYKAIQPFLAS